MALCCLLLACSAHRQEVPSSAEPDATAPKVQVEVNVQEQEAPPKEEDQAIPPTSEVFRFQLPAAKYYYGEKEERQLDPIEQSYIDDLKLLLDENLVQDQDLSDAARELSRYYAEKKASPPDSLVRMVLSRAGVGEMGPVFMYYALEPGGDLDEFNEQLALWVSTVIDENRVNTVGLGVHRVSGDGSDDSIDYITVLGVDRVVKLDAIPRIVPHENRFLVKGRCLTKGCRLKFYLHFLDEAVFDVPIKLRRQKFLFEVQIPSAPAIYHVEIVAVGKKKENRVLLNMPVYNGIDVPDVYDPSPRELACEKLEDCEKLLHETINSERKKVKVSPMNAKQSIVDVARVHAKDMLKNHYNSIYDRNGRNARLRLAEAKIVTMEAGEIVGGGYGMEEVVKQLLESPSLIEFVRKPHLSHMGCGVAGRETDSSRYFTVSCVVATIIDPREGEELSEAIFNRINHLRQKAGEKEFATESSLAEIADFAIGSLVKNPKDSKEIQGEVNIQIEESGLPMTRSSFGVFTIYSLDQLASNSSVRQIIESGHDFLVLGVRKIVDPQTSMRGIFVYYIGFH